MTYRRILSRPGISLLEVLTAIFIMGIGMMALLTLFPAGAISMARAVRDDRAATIAANAAATAAAFDLRNDPAITAALGDANFQPTATAPPGSPGNPVFVDPQMLSVPGASPLDVVNSPPGIQRIGPTFTESNPNPIQRRARFFTFQDEITFDPLGNLSNGNVYRPGTYSLAYMVRRPIADLSDVVDLSILVFAQRVTDYADGETPYPLPPPAGAPITANQDDTTIILPYTGTAPNIRRRSWVLDTTSNSTTRVINGHFYQVENVTDTGSSLQIELDRRLKATCSRFVHFRDLITVIERGSRW